MTMVCVRVVSHRYSGYNDCGHSDSYHSRRNAGRGRLATSPLHQRLAPIHRLLGAAFAFRQILFCAFHVTRRAWWWGYYDWVANVQILGHVGLIHCLGKWCFALSPTTRPTRPLLASCTYYFCLSPASLSALLLYHIILMPLQQYVYPRGVDRCASPGCQRRKHSLVSRIQQYWYARIIYSLYSPQRDLLSVTMHARVGKAFGKRTWCLVVLLLLSPLTLKTHVTGHRCTTEE